MGILDILGGLGGAGGQGGLSGLLTAAIGQAGGFQGILAKLNEAGLGSQVASWLGNGSNLPITADEIQAALGNDHLKQLAASLGIPLDQVAAVVAQHLPAAVDAASPNGTIQSS